MPPTVFIHTAGQWGLKLAEAWVGQVDLLRVREHLATLTKRAETWLR